WGPGNLAAALIQTSDGGFAIAGELASQVGLIKLDQNGTLQWARAYPAGQTPGNGGYAQSFAQTPDGGYVVGGRYGIAGSLVLRTDGSGNIVWEQTAGGQGGECIVANRPSGGFVVFRENFGTALHDDGTVDWANSYVGIEPASVTSGLDTGFAVAGS